MADTHQQLATLSRVVDRQAALVGKLRTKDDPAALTTAERILLMYMRAESNAYRTVITLAEFRFLSGAMERHAESRCAARTGSRPASA